MALKSKSSPKCKDDDDMKKTIVTKTIHILNCRVVGFDKEKISTCHFCKQRLETECIPVLELSFNINLQTSFEIVVDREFMYYCKNCIPNEMSLKKIISWNDFYSIIERTKQRKDAVFQNTIESIQKYMQRCMCCSRMVDEYDITIENYNSSPHFFSNENTKDIFQLVEQNWTKQINLIALIESPIYIIAQNHESLTNIQKNFIDNISEFVYLKLKKPNKARNSHINISNCRNDPISFSNNNSFQSINTIPSPISTFNFLSNDNSMNIGHRSELRSSQSSNSGNLLQRRSSRSFSESRLQSETINISNLSSSTSMLTDENQSTISSNTNTHNDQRSLHFGQTQNVQSNPSSFAMSSRMQNSSQLSTTQERLAEQRRRINRSQRHRSSPLPLSPSNQFFDNNDNFLHNTTDDLMLVQNSPFTEQSSNEINNSTTVDQMDEDCQTQSEVNNETRFSGRSITETQSSSLPLVQTQNIHHQDQSTLRLSQNTLYYLNQSTEFDLLEQLFTPNQSIEQISSQLLQKYKDDENIIFLAENTFYHKEMNRIVHSNFRFCSEICKSLFMENVQTIQSAFMNGNINTDKEIDKSNIIDFKDNEWVVSNWIDSTCLNLKNDFLINHLKRWEKELNISDSVSLICINN